MYNRKYDSDGHNVTPDPAVITTGTIIRMVSKDGGLGPFSDTVVLGIWATDKKERKHVYQTMADAIEAVRKEWSTSTDTKHTYPTGSDFDYKVNIELGRPYMYAASIGICFNWLTGVEKFSVNPRHILSNYKVVEMSTGKAANYNERPDTFYEVIVGNVGTVYKGSGERESRDVYDKYVDNSKHPSSRVSGEPVTLMCDGEILKEYEGTVNDG